MTKKILTILLLLFSINLYAESSYDRTVEVLDSTREEKVKQVFRELINAYQDEDARQFFEFVSEDRFLQDYITFSDGIYQDFRYYDILQVDYYFDQVVPKGIKRFLYVRWEKRYERLDTAEQLTQIGYSRFLFDEIDGKYYLIELAGNNLWADSVEEWREEVPSISGQVVYDPPPTAYPDLVIQNLDCPSGFGGAMPLTFDIVNIGESSTSSGSVEYTASGLSTPNPRTYPSDIASGESISISITGDCYSPISATVDPNNLIQESDETNNNLTQVF